MSVPKIAAVDCNKSSVANTLGYHSESDCADLIVIRMWNSTKVYDSV